MLLRQTLEHVFLVHRSYREQFVNSIRKKNLKQNQKKNVVFASIEKNRFTAKQRTYGKNFLATKSFNSSSRKIN